MVRMKFPVLRLWFFSVDGINEWIGNKPRTQKPFRSKLSSRLPTVRQKYRFSTRACFIQSDRWNGVVSPISNQVGSGTLSPREDRITQKTYFQLISQEARELNEFVFCCKKKS